MTNPYFVIISRGEAELAEENDRLITQPTAPNGRTTLVHRERSGGARHQTGIERRTIHYAVAARRILRPEFIRPVRLPGRIGSRGPRDLAPVGLG